jgi:hypothetical protein
MNHKCFSDADADLHGWREGLGQEARQEVDAQALHLAHPEGCAALRIVLGTVPRVSHSCEHCPDGFDFHLLHTCRDGGGALGSRRRARR